MHIYKKNHKHPQVIRIPEFIKGVTNERQDISAANTMRRMNFFLNGVRKTKTTAHSQAELFDYLIKDPETCKKNGVFVSPGIDSGKYGKGYVKISPSEHNKIFNSILLCEKNYKIPAK